MVDESEKKKHFQTVSDFKLDLPINSILKCYIQLYTYSSLQDKKNKIFTIIFNRYTCQFKFYCEI